MSTCNQSQSSWQNKVGKKATCTKLFGRPTFKKQIKNETRGGVAQPHTVPHDICESEKIALKLDRN